MADNSEKAAKRGPGRPFPPGQSGNPGGRPSLPEEFKAKGPGFFERMAKIAEDENHKHHFEALRWSLERIFGKAIQSHEVAAAQGLLAELLARKAPPIPEDVE